MLVEDAAAATTLSDLPAPAGGTAELATSMGKAVLKPERELVVEWSPVELPSEGPDDLWV